MKLWDIKENNDEYLLSFANGVEIPISEQQKINLLDNLTRILNESKGS